MAGASKSEHKPSTRPSSVLIPGKEIDDATGLFVGRRRDGVSGPGVLLKIMRLAFV